jgi:hypothetical protein
MDYMKDIKEISAEEAVFLIDLLHGFHSCTVIVKETVDALIASQRIDCFGNIGY